MPRSAASDPIRDFKFQVEIMPTGKLQTVASHISKLGFAVVSGLSVTNDVVSYREGGMNTHPHKMVGQSDFGPVTFSRGVFVNSTDMYKWQQFIHAWSAGSLGSDGSTSGANDYRATIGVKVLDHPESGAGYITDPTQLDQTVSLPPMRIGFVLYNCWPGAFAMTDLNASSSGILVQQMTMHHEGFVLVNNESEYAAATARG